MTDTTELVARLQARIGQLVAVLDYQMGTPCELIRHAYEVERLTRERDEARANCAGPVQPNAK
jgi:hypothetical protein